MILLASVWVMMFVETNHTVGRNAFATKEFCEKFRTFNNKPAPRDKLDCIEFELLTQEDYEEFKRKIK